jgi:AcrR family transcriptional regulator
VSSMARGRVRDTDAQQRILDATFELLSQRASGRVSMDEIALAARVGKQTIYRWWPSKHAVIIDSLLVNSVRDTPFRDTGDALADLRHHMRGVVRLFSSPTGIMVREVLAEASSDPKVAQDFIDRFWQPRRELSTEFLLRSIQRGQVRADIDVEAALDAIYAPLWARLLIGFAALSYQYVDDLLSVIWPGLAPTCVTAPQRP